MKRGIAGRRAYPRLNTGITQLECLRTILTSEVHPCGFLVGNMNGPIDLETRMGFEVDLAKDLVLAVESVYAEARGLRGRDGELERRTRREEREASHGLATFS